MAKEARLKYLFDAKEDSRFSAIVLEYNSQEEGSNEKLKLENTVKERTKVLLYLIPQRYLFVPEEDASAFFMDIIKDLDKIIDSFRISRMTYNMYLTQICRYRCMQYMKRKRSAEFTEKAIIYSDLSMYDMDLSERYCSYTIHQSPKLENLDMRTTIERMIDGNQDVRIKNSEAEEMLREALATKVSRRRFITFLLTLPETETDRFMNGVSRVLSIDKALVAHFYLLKHEELMVNREERERAQDIAGRYWKTLARLRRAIATETDEFRIEVLGNAYKRTKGIYEKRREKVIKAKKGLTQKQAAAILSLPRSTISNDICKIRKLLESVHEMMQT